MTLTAGHGPLSADPAGWFTPVLPDGTVYAEPHPRRVMAVAAGRTVIDTEDVVMVHRRGHPLSYAFRPDAVAGLPYTPAPEAPGYGYVPWNSVDTWFEEGRELVHYPPNPYHRVDCRPTDRRLRVSVAGTVLVETADTVVVFETALSPLLYVDPKHVRADLLRPSATTSYCNYKGWATYWSVVIDGEDGAMVDDVAWSYGQPFDETRSIAGFFSFDPARAEVSAALPLSTAR